MEARCAIVKRSSTARSGPTPLRTAVMSLAASVSDPGTASTVDLHTGVFLAVLICCFLIGGFFMGTQRGIKPELELGLSLGCRRKSKAADDQ